MEKGWLWDAVVMMFAERVNDCVERTCACDVWRAPLQVGGAQCIVRSMDASRWRD